MEITNKPYEGGCKDWFVAEIGLRQANIIYKALLEYKKMIPDTIKNRRELLIEAEKNDDEYLIQFFKKEIKEYETDLEQIYEMTKSLEEIGYNTTI